MKKFGILMLPAAAILFSLSVSVHADDHDKYRINVPADKWLPITDVIQKLKAQGYSVTKIEADDGVYEFDAINANGARIEGHAHPATGEILPNYDD